MPVRTIPAALADIYVDPSNPHVGDGSYANPYADLEYALARIKFDSGSGTRINIKAVPAMVDFTNLRTILGEKGNIASSKAPLIFQGYKTKSQDGGIAIATMFQNSQI